MKVDSLYTFAFNRKKRVCMICKKEYIPTSPIQKYCTHCAPLARQEQKNKYNERQRKRYFKKKLAKTT